MIANSARMLSGSATARTSPEDSRRPAPSAAVAMKDNFPFVINLGKASEFRMGEVPHHMEKRSPFLRTRHFLKLSRYQACAACVICGDNMR